MNSKYIVADGPDKELIEDLLAAAENIDLKPKSLQQRLYEAADRLHELAHPVAQANIVAVRVHGPAAISPWEDAKKKDPESGESMLDSLRELHAKLPLDKRQAVWLEYAYAAPVAQTGVPEGYALVPIEPTKVMLERGVEAGVNATPELWCPAVWKALLAAAPTPSKEEK